MSHFFISQRHNNHWPCRRLPEDGSPHSYRKQRRSWVHVLSWPVCTRRWADNELRVMLPRKPVFL